MGLGEKFGKVGLGRAGKRRGLFGGLDEREGGEGVEWGFAFDVSCLSFTIVSQELRLRVEVAGWKWDLEEWKG